MSRLIKAKFIQVSIGFHLSHSPFCEEVLLKALLRTNVLNDVTAAPFWVSFSQLAAGLYVVVPLVNIRRCQ